jgi:type 2A phosphatase activator TIP41
MSATVAPTVGPIPEASGPPALPEKAEWCGHGWRVIAQNNSPMASQSELADIGSQTGLQSTPEAVFKDHTLLFAHESGVHIRVDAAEVLRGCLLHEERPDLAPSSMAPPKVEVKQAAAWKKEAEARKPTDEAAGYVVQDIDWTYDWTWTTRWWGCPEIDGKPLTAEVDDDGELPMDLLTAKDDILWYQEFRLYWDDLGDSGDVEYVVRARVMPRFFFVLARMSLRVDDVIIRQVDTRWLHIFDSNEIVREWSWRELPTDSARKRINSASVAHDVLGPNLLEPRDTARRTFHRFRISS